MAGRDKMILRGIDFAKGDYFKRKNQALSPLQNVPICFLPKSEKTEDWKAAISDYYEQIGLAKVSNHYEEIIKNRRLSSGRIDLNDYIKNPIEKAGLNVPEVKNEDITGYDFYPLVPNLVNLFTGYQLKRNNKFVFSTIDPFSRAKMFETKDKILQEELHNIRMEMRDNGGEIDDAAAHQRMMQAADKFKKYQDIGVEWANRVHKINFERHGMRNLIKQAFKESYLNSSRVIFHINMMNDRFVVEHIDEAFSFNGPSINSTDLTESGMIGWFKWMNIGEVLDNFGKKLKDEDIEKLKYVNTTIGTSNNLNLINYWNNEVQDRTAEGGTAALMSEEGYDTTKPYIAQPNEPLDIARYKRHIEETSGLTFNGRTIKQKLPEINPEFDYGDDNMFRVMYLYKEDQRRIGWLTKIDRTGQIVYQDWINEDFIVTEEPVYNQQLLKEMSVDNLVYGEHIDWEWIPDWRRFITISPNHAYKHYNNSLGNKLEKIYLDGNSLNFQFKNDKTPYGVKPPVAAIEIKQRGVRAVPMVSLLKQDQVLYNICKNRVKFTLRDDRGLQLVYQNNLVSRDDSDEEGTGDYIDEFHRGIKKNKEIKINYDRQYLGGTGNQMGVPYTLDLSTVRFALEYDQLAERIFYNALRTVGFSPQAAAEIKASEEVSNVQSAQQISQVQTEIIYDEFNTRLLPDLFTKMLEATQYYSTINKDFRLMYLNDNDENTWLDITGIDILHKDFACTPRYSFDNEEFTAALKNLSMQNTVEASMSTRLKAIWSANENPAKVITMLEESEEKAQQNAQAAEKAKQQDLQAKRDHEKQLQDEMVANDNQQKELDRQSKEYIAGIQFDSATYQQKEQPQTDNGQTVKNQLKQKELSQQDSHNQRILNLQEQQHNDNITLEQQKILQKDRADRMKLKEAVANRNKYSKTSTDKSALKK